VSFVFSTFDSLQWDSAHFRIESREATGEYRPRLIRTFEPSRAVATLFGPADGVGDA
jgi:hypothetical protein